MVRTSRWLRIQAVLWILLASVAWEAPALGTWWQSSNTESVSATEPTGALPDADRLHDILSGSAIPKSVDDLRAMQDHIAGLADRVKQATVGVDCGGAQGSGVIISRDGLVLTAAHVIGAPGLDATVRMADGTILPAKSKGLVHLLDSGLLQISQPGEYVYLDMGESSELKLGQWVMAVGHPGGFEAARGIVVRVGRILTLTPRVIRTDCTLVGGDSGGPLVDMDGYVIGIHSRIGARLTDNMHVPINVYLEGWDQLEADEEVGGRPGRPGLGITLKGTEGLEIESVEPDGAADKAGVQPGDILLELNGREIKTRQQLGQELDELEIGGSATIRLLRGDEEIELPLVIGRR